FTYTIGRADLGRLEPVIGRRLGGNLATAGRATGPWTALRIAGDGSVNALEASGVDAVTVSAKYDATIRSGDFARADATATGEASFLTVFGTAVQQASGTFALAEERLGFDVRLTLTEGRAGALEGRVVLHPDRRAIDVAALKLTLDHAPWQLDPGATPPSVAWNDDGITVGAMRFVGGAAADERIDVAGTWRTDGRGALRVQAKHVFLETLQGAFEQPARYGGLVDDLDATISGTRDHPIVSGTISIVDGRVRRLSYQKLAGRIALADQMFDVDLRLDQAPGVWLTAKGSAPRALVRDDLPERAMDIAIVSSPIGLALLEGLTDVVDQVAGSMRIDVRVIGTTRDPHFQGTLALDDAGFRVVSSGARYKHGRALFRLTSDRVAIESFHVEDANGRPLDVHGSLATHELTVGDLEIDASARRFEVLRNQFGRIEADAVLRLRGKFETPRLGGTITLVGGDLKVDEILDRLLFQPYA